MNEDSESPRFSPRSRPVRSDAPLPEPPIPEAQLKAIEEAHEVLEHPGLATRLTELVGMPVERGMQMLPTAASEAINSATMKALTKALDLAVSTLGDNTDAGPRLWSHKLMAGVSGAAGGAFGLPALAIELPLSTVLILRSVADIARSHGEDLSEIEARLACLEVFALGSGRNAAEEEGMEVGYLAVRAGLAKHVSDAAKHLARKGLSEPAAPPLVRFIAVIAKRFGVVVSEKVAAQAVPIIGAAGGALLNTFFIDHYQDVARAHFTIRALEREHGADVIRRLYRAMK